MVSDAWDKGYNRDANDEVIDAARFGASDGWLTGVDPALSSIVPGMGLKAHRDAYNVLYGDGSARVFGDPQQRLIWHRSAFRTTPTGNTRGPAFANLNMEVGLVANNSYAYWGTTGFYGGGGYFNAYDATGWANALAHMSANAYGIWHNFDVAAGIDVGVDGLTD